MKCPSCDHTLFEKNAGGVLLDLCHGGCGGIWFDARELEGLNARGAASLHTVWRMDHQTRPADKVLLCPRCGDQALERKWFSEAKSVEIDQCPSCAGIWLDDGEFSKIAEEVKMPGIAPLGWEMAMAKAAAFVSKNQTL
ncbi:MAG: hypothetical protein JWM59_1951 [Verrucomicrobiales bacterium]|nr:hypothetical protein [Verrucomicrobiales bacterium]